MFRAQKFVLPCLILLSIVAVMYYSFWMNREEEVYLLSDEEVQQIYRNQTPRLFAIRNFQYTIDSTICNTSKEYLAIFIVTSYFGNMETRSAMRRSFSNKVLEDLNLKRVFLLGEAFQDKFTSQKAVLDESRRFGDLIQGNFKEAYRNLTYKHIMGLKWVNSRCYKNAKYVIKMDDDTVIDVQKIKVLLEETKFPSNLLAGYILNGMVPIREPANKWYVTLEEYQGDMYPKFVSGWFYITNQKTVSKILQKVPKNQYFWIDDVYVTGILAKQIQVTHYDLSRFFAVHAEYLQCCLQDLRANLNCDLLIGPNGGDNNLFYTFNEAVKKCRRVVCTNRTKSIDETCVAERKLNLGRGNAVIKTLKLH